MRSSLITIGVVLPRRRRRRVWRRQADQLDHDAPAGRRAGTARPLAVHVEGHEPVLADEPGQSLGLDRDGRARPAVSRLRSRSHRNDPRDRSGGRSRRRPQDGALVEDTYDWYVQDAGNVWYLGEETKEYEHGKVVSTEGSWKAGVDGAQAGIIMPAEPRAERPSGRSTTRGRPRIVRGSSASTSGPKCRSARSARSS